MVRLTARMDDGTSYVCSETGNEGVGYFTTQRRLPELIAKLATYEDAEEQGRLVVLGSGNYPTLADLWSIYESLIAVHDGDGEETYTNGYRWGHRNGQIELLQYILQISDGSCEASELEAAEAKWEDED